jgi:excinuclease UvrABC helicase subunit UvrB
VQTIGRAAQNENGREIMYAYRTRKDMEKPAKELEFMEAARLRDEYLAIQKLIEGKW